jgi:hypothetical protein
MRRMFDELWLDHTTIIVVRPAALYLPLAAAVVEWENSAAVHKAAGYQ